jgi:Holliday junction resolvase RusA-like endonuclease
MKLTIPGRLPGMNEIIKLAKQGKGHYQPYAQIKEMYETVIIIECKKQKLTPITKQVDVSILWGCKDCKRDKDNIIAGQKIILDSLQKAGILEGDGWKYIGNISHKFEIVPKEFIEVELTEVD